jgi:mono/diheme cytochrome c family protein
MTQPINTSKDNDAFGAFAGIVILMVILSIVFGFTTPNVSSNDNAADVEDEAEIVAIDEATAEVTDVSIEAATEAVIVAEVTEIATATTYAAVSAIQAAVVVTEATEVATEEVVVAEVTEDATEATEAAVVAEVTQEATVEVAAVNAETASGDYDPEMVARGQQLFIVCTACHGPDGRGLPGLGKDLVAGEFATTATDEELHALITSGRPIWDAANTTMVDMPPKGGNPTLTEEDITAIVAYIRSLQIP